MTIRALFATVFLLLSPAAVSAACQTTASTPLTFAASSSYDVRSNSVAQVSSAAGFACSGSIIVVLGSNHARATVTSAGGMKLTGPTGDTIPYQVSADAAGNYPFTQGGTINYMETSLLSLLGILNGGTFAPKMFGIVTGGANVAAGSYTDTLTVQWSWSVCHVGVGNVCVLGESGSATAVINVSLQVSKDCRIVAPSASFGSAPLVGQFATINPAILIDCTKSASYKVAFSSGASGASRPWRAMSDGAGHSLQYNLYRSDGTTIWDETNPLTSSVLGTGATVPAQVHTYQAKINPAQVTPPAGHYSDTVSVVISF